MHACGIKCMYAEIIGCMYADFGCISMERLGAKYTVVGCKYAVVGCKYMEQLGAMPDSR